MLIMAGAPEDQRMTNEQVIKSFNMEIQSINRVMSYLLRIDPGNQSEAIKATQDQVWISMKRIAFMSLKNQFRTKIVFLR